MPLDPDAERRILAQIQALKLEVAEGRGDASNIQRGLDVLANTIHDSYAGGPGIGPRVISMSDNQNRPGSRSGPGVSLPDADWVRSMGEALKVWGPRSLYIALGLVLLWKLAAGDLVDSVQRLWWVFNPPETVEEVQEGFLPSDGVVPPSNEP